jgi:putative DNA primase/helicase
MKKKITVTKYKLSPTDIVLSRSDWPDAARKFLDKHRPNLINQQDEFLDWNGGAYISVEDATIRSEISKFAEDCFELVFETNPKTGAVRTAYAPFHPKKSDIDQIVEATSNERHKPRDTMSPPCWLDGRKGNPKDIISCENGLLNIRTRKMIDQTPAFFTRTLIPVKYDANAPVPDRWMKFMLEVMKDRQHLVDVIQEIFGYLLSGDISLHKVFHFHGVPAAGKSTIINILTALIGPANCDYSSIASIGGRFGKQNLLGKSVSFVADMDTGNPNHVNAAISEINTISGADPVTVERKNILSWYGRLPTRFVLAGNTLPNVGSHAKAFMRRVLSLPFDVSFLGREDTQLEGKLLLELAGILNWALDGLSKLQARGKFAEPEESKAIKKRMENIADPLNGFIVERCRLHPKTEVHKDVLFGEYTEYLEECRAKAVPMFKFTEDLQNLFPQVGQGKTGHAGKKGRVYRGIRLNNAITPKWYKHDPELLTLFGKPCMETLLRDASGKLTPLKGSTGSDFDE